MIPGRQINRSTSTNQRENINTNSTYHETQTFLHLRASITATAAATGRFSFSPGKNNGPDRNQRSSSLINALTGQFEPNTPRRHEVRRGFIHSQPPTTLEPAEQGRAGDPSRQNHQHQPRNHHSSFQITSCNNDQIASGSDTRCAFS